MNRMKPWLLLTALTAICFGAASKQHVDWAWQGRSIYSVLHDGKTLQLGLANDGCVVWRELKETEVVTHFGHTNSPAEEDLAGLIRFANTIAGENWKELDSILLSRTTNCWLEVQ